MHPSNTTRLASPLVSVVQEGGQPWAAADLLQLRDNLVEARQSLGVKTGLSAVLQACLLENGDPGRSLAKEFLDHGEGCGLRSQGGRVIPMVSLKELFAGEEGKVEGSVLGQLSWGPSALLELSQDTGSSILVQGEWGPLDLPASILISNLILVKEPARPASILVREWKQLQVETKEVDSIDEEVEVFAAVIERGPVLPGKSGRLYCLVVLELEGEGRSLVKVEALATLLHWVSGCKLSLPASSLRPLHSLLDWDHTALLGPLPLLHIPDGTRIRIIKSEQIGQVL